MTSSGPAGGGAGAPHARAVPRSGKPAVSRPDDIRRHNLSLVLREVHRDGPLTRAQLTQRLALSRSTIGTLVNDLRELHLLQESVPVGGQRAGRPSHVVAPRPDGPYAIAVDLEVDRLTVAAVTVGGRLARRRVDMLGPSHRSARAAAGAVADAVRRVAGEMPAHSWPVGVGVSVPGTVRAADGFVEVAPNLGWHGEPLGRMLRHELPEFALALANDADMGVLAEHLRGAARDATEVVYLTGKVGVGAGILVNGRPLRGAGGLVGEVGHTVVDQGGRPCHCGGRGCAEGLIGEEALLRLAGRSGAPDPDAVAAVLTDARNGDPAARAGVDRVARALGQVLANLVNLLNPQTIVLGGALSDVFSCAGPLVLTELDGQAMAAARAMVEIRVSALGADSSLLGAAEQVFQELLVDPLTAAGH